MCFVNSVLFFIGDSDYTIFIEKENLFSSIFWFVIGIIATYQVYRVQTKKIYLVLNETNIFSKLYNGKGTVFEFSDAEFYTAKQSHRGFVIHYKSLDDGKKKVIPLNMFNVDSKEFLKLLSKQSGKDVFIKEYGEEQKLFEINDSF
jgi:hypothetical protein